MHSSVDTVNAGKLSPGGRRGTQKVARAERSEPLDEMARKESPEGAKEIFDIEDSWPRAGPLQSNT
jgi:hypothetical protein